MSQSIILYISLVTSISCSCVALPKITRLAKRNWQKQSDEYSQEFEAHRCGRAIAAIINIKKAELNFETDDDSQRKLSAVTQRLIGAIENSMGPSSVMTSHECRLRKNHLRGAVIYKFDRFAGSSHEPNYGYRLQQQ